MELFIKRLQKLKKLLNYEECESLIIEDPISLYYLTGIEMSAGRLIAHSQGAHLFVDSRYYEICKKIAPFPVVLSDNGLPIKDIFSIAELHLVKFLGFSSENTTYTRFLQLEKALIDFNAENKTQVTLKGIEDPVAKLRTIKDDEEIKILKQAADLGSAGFDFVCSLLKEGVTEKEVATELEIYWKRRGSKGLAFDPIIAFGANTSMPHYRAGDRKLKKGDNVLIDIGVNINHYHSDMTRVVYFGNPNPKILTIHEMVLEAQRRALNLCKPGTLIGDLDKAARGFIAEKGYGKNFMHGLGHGVGLEIHEAPSLRDTPLLSQIPLEEGMVITIEPGIYLPDIGGVRLEDTVVITASGHENLTNRSKEPITFP